MVRRRWLRVVGRPWTCRWIPQVRVRGAAVSVSGWGVEDVVRDGAGLNGVGSVSFGQSAPEMSYRVVFAGGTSNVITIDLQTPTVTVDGPTTLAPGGRATLDVSVDPASSGTGALQYQYPDGAWKTSSATVPVSNGVGSVSFGQSAPEMSYRVVFAGGTSNVITIDLATPTVTIDGPTTLAPGGRATLDVSVDPASSGTGKLQYQYPDGAWKTSSATVPVSNGVGSVSFGQSAPEMSYRVVFAGGTSNVITIDLQTPTVTIDGPTTLAPGGRATLDVSVDPASSGTGALQYQYPDGAWKTSRTTVSISNGYGLSEFRSVGSRDVVSGGVRWWYVEHHHD